MDRSRTFEHRTALVTGAGSGIGKALALELASRGANVAVTDIDQQSVDATLSELASTSVGARAYRVDHSQQAEVSALHEAVRADFGDVDVLCPGIVRTKLLENGRFSLDAQGISKAAADRMWQRIGERRSTMGDGSGGFYETNRFSCRRDQGFWIAGHAPTP